MFTLRSAIESRSFDGMTTSSDPVEVRLLTAADVAVLDRPHRVRAPGLAAPAVHRVHMATGLEGTMAKLFRRHYFDCEGTTLACYDPKADGDGHEARPVPEPIYIAGTFTIRSEARCAL